MINSNVYRNRKPWEIRLWNPKRLSFQFYIIIINLCGNYIIFILTIFVFNPFIISVSNSSPLITTIKSMVWHLTTKVIHFTVMRFFCCTFFFFLGNFCKETKWFYSFTTFDVHHIQKWSSRNVRKGFMVSENVNYWKLDKKYWHVILWSNPKNQCAIVCRETSFVRILLMRKFASHSLNTRSMTRVHGKMKILLVRFPT